MPFVRIAWKFADCYRTLVPAGYVVSCLLAKLISPDVCLFKVSDTFEWERRTSRGAGKLEFQDKIISYLCLQNAEGVL